MGFENTIYELQPSYDIGTISSSDIKTIDVNMVVVMESEVLLLSPIHKHQVTRNYVYRDHMIDISCMYTYE